MAQLIVRNLPADLVHRLKKQAAEHHRSAEAEHREILIQALLGEPKKSLLEYLREMPEVGDDFFPPRERSRRKVDLP